MPWPPASPAASPADPGARPPAQTLPQKVTLERPLPFPIAAGVNKVALHQPAPTVTESGVEGMTLAMKWELYAGHHLVSARCPPFIHI